MKYLVTVAHRVTTYRSAMVEVEAENDLSACDKAVALAENGKAKWDDATVEGDEVSAVDCEPC